MATDPGPTRDPAASGDPAARRLPDRTGEGDAPTEAAAVPTSETVGVPRAGRRSLPSSRVSTVWITVCAIAIVLLALIVFLLQNTQRTTVSFLWMEGSAPVAVTLLIAAVAAALITALVGTVRIAQLRRLSRRQVEAPGNSSRDEGTPTTEI
jgi:lipopolysaccharide assembly protein A